MERLNLLRRPHYPFSLDFMPPGVSMRVCRNEVLHDLLDIKDPDAYEYSYATTRFYYDNRLGKSDRFSLVDFTETELLICFPPYALPRNCRKRWFSEGNNCYILLVVTESDFKVLKRGIKPYMLAQSHLPGDLLNLLCGRMDAQTWRAQSQARKAAAIIMGEYDVLND